MAAGPHRRAERRKHLDAATVPVEKALIALAGQSAETAAELSKAFPGLSAQEAMVVNEVVAHALAEYSRKLAEELHFW
jgi:hypothetical protein